jgi:hypothetical protein
LYHEKLNGPVPPGLAAVNSPCCEPVVLQYMNTGSLTPGADG